MNNLFTSLFVWAVPLTILLFSFDSLSAQPPSIDCADIVNPFYFGEPGYANLTIAGGVAPYLLSWSGPVSGTEQLLSEGDYTLDSLPAGNYSLELTDTEGSSSNCSFEIVNPDCDLSMSIAGFPPNCAGSADGIVVFSIDAALTIEGIELLDMPEKSFEFFGIRTFGYSELPAGSYTVRVTDARGCFVQDSVTISDPSELELDCSGIIQPSTPDSEDGSITPAITGGALPYNLSWEGPQSGDSLLPDASGFLLSELPEGIYSIEVTDYKGCSTFCSVVLDSNTDCNLSLFLSSNDLTCPGDNSGSIHLELSGGTPPLQYNWSDDAYDGQGASGELSGLDAELYFLTITDAEQCQAVAGTIIDAPPALNLHCTPAVFPSHQDSSDGNFFINIQDGPGGPYTVTYDNNDGVAGSTEISSSLYSIGTIFDVPEGIYEVTVTSPMGCMATCQVDMNIPDCEADLFSLPLSVNNAPSCFGASDGLATIVLNQGNLEDYTFDWNVDTYDGQSTVENLPGGIYYITVTDENGCVEMTSGQGWIAPPPLLISCSDTLSPSAPGLGNGGNNLLIAGGVPPYNVSWDGPESGDINTFFTGNLLIDHLSAGGYSVSVEDNNGCTSECSFVITDPEPPCLLLLECRENVIGEGQGPGSYTFFIEGGTAPYDLQLSGASDIHFTLNDPGSWNSEVLPLGDWEFTVVDANGCTESCSFSIVADCNLTIMPQLVHESCQGSMDGSISPIVMGTPPYSFHWATGDTSAALTGLAPGLYTVTIADSDGCSAILNLPIQPGGEPSFATLNDTLCTGSLIQIGGQTFDSNNPTGIATIPNQSNCDSIIQVSLHFLPGTSSFIDSTLCSGQSILINGQTFDQSNPSGTVTLQGAAVNGCDSTINIELEFFPEASAFIDSILCSGQSILINGQTFDQSNPSGTVILQGAATNGCDSTINIELEFFPEASSFIDSTLCSGQSILINGQTFDQNNPSGTVILQGAATNGCDSTINIELEFFPEASSFIDSTLCTGQSILINGQTFDQNNPSGTVILQGAAVNGCDSTINIELEFFPEASSFIDSTLCSGQSILINGQTFDQNNPSGSVILQGAAVNGCDSTINIELEFFPEASSFIDSTLCSGQSILINGQTFDQNNPSGTVILQGAAVNGCDSIINVHLNFSNPVLTLSPSEGYGIYNINCADAANGVIDAIVDGGLPPYSFLWDNGATQQQLSGLTAGTYTVSVTDAAGCTIDAGLTLIAPPPIELYAEGVRSICDEVPSIIFIDSITGGSGNYEYSIDGLFFSPADSFPIQIILPDRMENTVGLCIQDTHDCQTTISIDLVHEDNPPEVVINPPSASIQLGDSILVSPQLTFTPAEWSWHPLEGISTPDSLQTYLSPSQTTLYSLQLVDQLGCIVEAHYQVIVASSGLYLPNSFSPNGDGANDTFTAYAGKSVEYIEYLEIYNRWGSLVFRAENFQANNPALGWDGTYKGQPMNSGTYVYRLKARLINGKLESKNGSISLLR
jgi:gliding motility-associated-like protein